MEARPCVEPSSFNSSRSRLAALSRAPRWRRSESLAPTRVHVRSRAPPPAEEARLHLAHPRSRRDRHLSSRHDPRSRRDRRLSRRHDPRSRRDRRLSSRHDPRRRRDRHLSSRRDRRRRRDRHLSSRHDPRSRRDRRHSSRHDPRRRRDLRWHRPRRSLDPIVRAPAPEPDRTPGDQTQDVRTPHAPTRDVRTQARDQTPGALTRRDPPPVVPTTADLVRYRAQMQAVPITAALIRDVLTLPVPIPVRRARRITAGLDPRRRILDARTRGPCRLDRRTSRRLERCTRRRVISRRLPFAARTSYRARRTTITTGTITAARA